MTYYNHRYKSMKSRNLMIKIAILMGIILILFLLIWKMPAKQTTVTEDIQIPNITSK